MSWARARELAASAVGPVAIRDVPLEVAAGAVLAREVLGVGRGTVDVVVFGDELVTAGPARDGRIRDALGPMLSAWLPALGLQVVARRHVPDSFEALAVAVAASTADLMVTTGSTARG